MGIAILEKFFPAKTVVTSAIIRAEIAEREIEIKLLQAEIGPKLAAIATMTDAEHVKAEADVAANKRAIDRLDQRIAHLQSELPTVLAAEGMPQKQPPTPRFAPVPKPVARPTKRTPRSCSESMTSTPTRSASSSQS